MTGDADGQFRVPPLRHGFDALAPAMGASALRAHHEVVHIAYLSAINRMLAPYPHLAERSIEQILTDPGALPPEIRDAALDAGGAHANHQFLWKVLGPSGGSIPTGALAIAIDRDFGSVDVFHRKFTDRALALEGPGWGFLSLAAPRTDRLEIVVLPGNGNVLSIGKPGILVCDLWGHAWAADHSSRDEWLQAFRTIIDWDVCSARYLALREGRQPS